MAPHDPPPIEAPLAPAEAPWRPIHYLGSKLRIVAAVRAALDRADPARGPVCDLFAGSGVVAAALAAERDVVAADIQEYARVICSAVLRPCGGLGPPAARAAVLHAAERSPTRARLLAAAEPLLRHEEHCLARARLDDAEPLCALVEHGSILAAAQDGTPPGALGEALAATARALAALPAEDAVAALALRHFGGLYFSYRQAAELGALAALAHAEADAARRDALLAALASTASEVVNTVGKQFAQPIRPRGRAGRPKPHLVRQALRDRAAEVPAVFARWLGRYGALLATPGSGRPHRALRGDYRAVLGGLRPGEVGVVYADPPYTRDHYSRFYHVLETLCRGDAPEVSRTTRGPGLALSRGLYRRDRHQSPFCIASQAPGAFEALFAAARGLGAPLVLSYSPYAPDGRARPRVMRIGEVAALARRHFAAVETLPAVPIGHTKLNATGLNAAVTREAELLLICRPG